MKFYNFVNLKNQLYTIRSQISEAEHFSYVWFNKIYVKLHLVIFLEKTN